MIDLFPIAGPLLRSLPPETAHLLTILSLRTGFSPRQRAPDDPLLATRVYNLDFSNPVGIAAGFDKNAEVITPMIDMGLGFVEVGTVTPRPQPGNPTPRMFRLPAQWGLINRLGFNNKGLDYAVGRLARHRPRRGVIGVNIGKNKTQDDAVADYVTGIAAVADHVDYIALNVSSPNTPGLRALQGRAPLTTLLQQAIAARDATVTRPPLLLKIAPDLTDDDKRDIAEVSLAAGIDGLIVSNTTITRPPGLPEDRARETGGLSGRPLFALSTAVLAQMYRLTGGRLPIIGVGGITGADEAYAKIRAGASLIQIYTGLIYGGPALIRDIKTGLVARLRADGFDNVAAAVGADHR
ncbi:MAG: quinone-dependent dihydroorotate dehydrogenase [Azospirillaceae bacterium]|nr:quinone-dependent dihydroorotate dehydrogenase [Azospirillaceae bacterium]